jgi:RimJ/RimL family protein N-acetyltransferase
MIIPTLVTERLTLRPVARGDLDACATIWADAEFTRFIGGPYDRHEVWHNLAAVAGCWVLEGVGPLSVVERASGRLVGRAGLWDEPGWPGIEAIWFIGKPWWGKGYATEAGAASITWAFANRDIVEVAACIQPANTTSVRVAERLGMRYDRMESLHGSDNAVYVVDRQAWESSSRR